MNKIYTGIGSRELPELYKNVIYRISKILDDSGYILRSGGADGSDLAFEFNSTNKEIFVPWIGFNNSKSSLLPISKSLDFVKLIHPAFDKLNRASRLLHMRNIHQILGQDLNSPTDFVVCYTQNGQTIGGTATAIRLAKSLNIPIFNIGTYDLKIIDTEYIVDEFLQFKTNIEKI